jgi:hypothetical protein
VLSSIVLAILSVIGGVEQNPGPGVEAENAVQLVCTGCGRNLKSESNVNCVEVGIITAVEA